MRRKPNTQDLGSAQQLYFVKYFCGACMYVWQKTDVWPFAFLFKGGEDLSSDGRKWKPEPQESCDTLSAALAAQVPSWATGGSQLIYFG